MAHAIFFLERINNKKERINRSFVRTMFLIRALLRWKPVVHD